MKRCLLSVACLVLLLTSQSWAGQFGPIKSRVDAGQLYLAAGYTWLSETYDTGSYTNGEIDVKQHSVYAQTGIGIGSGWEVNLRGGASNFTIEKPYHLIQDDEESDDLRPFVGLGVGGPVFQSGTLQGGPFLQASYYSDYEASQNSGTETISGVRDDGSPFGPVPFQENVFFDKALAVDVGFTFQMTIEGAHLYFGPIYSYYDSTIESETVATDNSGVVYAKTTVSDVEVDAPLGGFIGISWPLSDKLHLDIEGRFQSGAVIGTQVLYSF